MFSSAVVVTATGNRLEGNGQQPTTEREEMRRMSWMMGGDHELRTTAMHNLLGSCLNNSNFLLVPSPPGVSREGGNAVRSSSAAYCRCLDGETLKPRCFGNLDINV